MNYTRPKCFRLTQWLEYSKGGNHDPCLYCTPQYKADMLTEKKCDNPQTIFYNVEYYESKTGLITEVFGSSNEGLSLIEFFAGRIKKIEAVK